ncbi:hypothetical protein CFP75_31800 [Amycolatopsis alba DSM 44262]|uniref:Uncharacterized protein n=1 Tax=Amycolatopsis alba DSM 44262 TaxID=1125972 RepID=A0A229REW0_AMYAL|nr:hypothetical protein CFP75_31800 [Amycolatopsis alba DSM 44262]
MFFRQRLLQSWRAKPSAALSLSSLFLALAVALQIPPVHDVLAYKAGWNLFWPTQWALTIACCLMVHIFAIRAVATSRNQARLATRRITALMGAAFLVAFALFSTDPDHPDFVLGPQSRLEVPGHVPILVGLAWVVVMATLASSAMTHAVRAWHWAAKSPEPTKAWLRAGLRISAAGFGVGVLYCLHSAAYQTAEMVGWIPAWTQQSVSDPLITAAPTLIFIGSVLPAIESWHRERLDGTRLLRRLEPIRRLLVAQVSLEHLTAIQRLQRLLLHHWRPMILVYQLMIDFEDALLRIQQEVPMALSRYTINQAYRKDIDDNERRAVVVAVVLAAWAGVPHAVETPEGFLENRIDRIVGIVLKLAEHRHMPPLEDSENAQQETTLITDLDRWLRAADLLRDFPVDLDTMALGSSHH